jgi:hypothetical protein
LLKQGSVLLRTLQKGVDKFSWRLHCNGRTRLKWNSFCVSCGISLPLRVAVLQSTAWHVTGISVGSETLRLRRDPRMSEHSQQGLFLLLEPRGHRAHTAYSRYMGTSTLRNRLARNSVQHSKPTERCSLNGVT